MYFKTFQIPDKREKGNKMCVLDIWYEFFLMNYRWKFFEAQPRFHMTHDECLRIGTRREREWWGILWKFQLMLNMKNKKKTKT